MSDFQMAVAICTLKSKVGQKPFLWALRYDRTCLVREEREGNGRAIAEVYFLFLLLLHFSFSFPRLKIIRKGLRIKIMTGDFLLKCYKRNSSISFPPFSIVVTINLGS